MVHNMSLRAPNSVACLVVAAIPSPKQKQHIAVSQFAQSYPGTMATAICNGNNTYKNGPQTNHHVMLIWMGESVLLHSSSVMCKGLMQDFEHFGADKLLEIVLENTMKTLASCCADATPNTKSIFSFTQLSMGMSHTRKTGSPDEYLVTRLKSVWARFSLRSKLLDNPLCTDVSISRFYSEYFVIKLWQTAPEWVQLCLFLCLRLLNEIK